MIDEGRGEVRVVGLDVGKARVGVALSDPLGLTAQPMPTLSRQPESTFLTNLANLLQTHAVETVVLGLPLGLKGQKGSSHADVMELLGKCQERWPEIRWETIDERFTTTMAGEVMREAPKKRRETKGFADRIAAQLILQDYLDRRRSRQEKGGEG